MGRFERQLATPFHNKVLKRPTFIIEHMDPRRVVGVLHFYG